MIKDIENAKNTEELLEYVEDFCGTLAITKDIPDRDWFKRVCEQYVKIKHNSNIISRYIIEPLKFANRNE